MNEKRRMIAPPLFAKAILHLQCTTSGAILQPFLRQLFQRLTALEYHQQHQTDDHAHSALHQIAGDAGRSAPALAQQQGGVAEVAQHHDDLAADGAQQREAKGLFAAGTEDQRRDHGRTPFDDERAGRVAHVAGDHIRQTGAETGSHAAVERASQQGGEYDHDVAGVEIAAGHGRDLDDERRHAAQRHEHGGVDEISEFLVHNYHLFMLLAQEYDIRHK